MNFGPLEFAHYLRRGEECPGSATVRAARAASPEQVPVNRLSVISGPPALTGAPRNDRLEAVNVYEAVAVVSPRDRSRSETVEVLVRSTPRPVVLVLSSHQPLEWRLAPAPGARIAAALISGFGMASVVGLAPDLVHRIGGFYVFRRGSVEFRHLEAEVLRCTGRSIEDFQRVYGEARFEIG